ncbi:DUF4123 domain-containing protein [Halomonas salina]|uniref:DUF4123 domain-containing protein n=1 Tax=Halomonas salina TaxID=42565 RepID=UPI0006892D4B|nr:DUF4123 domain-containing protein [Halomonas salina]
MSQRDRADSLESLLLEDKERDTWVVIEQEARTLRRIYELEASPDLDYLFHGTRYAEWSEKSPLAVRVSPSSPLWQAFVDDQGEPPLRGVMAVSSAPKQAVMAHLQKLLEVMFYGGRRALLRFYDPWIMAVLMSADSPSARWLGPLARVYWYGGTFAQRAESGAAWHAVKQAAGESDAVDSIAQEMITLTREEESALEAFVSDYPLWAELEAKAGLDAGSAQHAACFISVLEEADRLSIPQTEWRSYLTLRFVHHREGLPENMETLPAEERLEALRHHIDHAAHETNTGKVWA